MKSKPNALSFIRKSLSPRKTWTACISMLTVALLMGTGRFLSLPSPAPTPQLAAESVTKPLAAIQEAYGKLPLSFEAPPRSVTNAQFVARGAGYRLGINPHQVQIQLYPTHRVSRPQRQNTAPLPKPTQFKMEVVGANAAAQARTSEPLNAKANYLVGKNPAQWQQNLPTFGRIEYAEVYPDINLVYYGNQRQLEYDFVVKPGADPQQIKLKFDGAEQVNINSAGELVLRAENREIKHHKPFVYQEVNGQKQQIEAEYAMLANNEVGFRLGRYNPMLTLVIDPVLAYSTYFGGGAGEIIFDIAIDRQGASYITGVTASADFPVKHALQSELKVGEEDYDVFVAKLRADGSALVYSTYLGGTDYDLGVSLTTDARGNVYVSGYTESSYFPTAHPLQAKYRGEGDTFVAKLSAAGDQLLYATYLGGTGADSGGSIKLDGRQNPYLIGYTKSADFPTQNALQDTLKGDIDLFVAKLAADGSALRYATYFGGSGNESLVSSALIVDNDGYAYVMTDTDSKDFPTEKPLQAKFAGGESDLVLAKFKPDGSGLVYSTYLGGSEKDASGNQLAVDQRGNLYLAASTSSTDFPTHNAYQSQYGGGEMDGIIAKLNPAGSALLYATYYGGSARDEIFGMDVDTTGHIYVGGNTTSPNLPLANALQWQFAGAGAELQTGDAFVAKFSANGKVLQFGTYFGGSDDEDVFALMLDTRDNVYLAGSTRSTNFPTQNALQMVFGGTEDGFVTKIAMKTDCHSVCLYAPDYWLLFPQRRPAGVIYLDQFFAYPTNSPVVLVALQGGNSPIQRLRAEFAAYQLSLLATPWPQLLTAQPIGCLGNAFLPVTLSNQDVVDVDMKGNEFFLQIQEAFRRHNQEDIKNLATLLDHLHGKGLGGCSRNAATSRGE